MPRFACIDASNAFFHPEKFRFFDVKPPDLPHKGLRWLPANPVAAPSFDAKLEVLEGPTHTIGATSVTESWSVRAKTAQEIDADKDAAVNGLNNSHYQALLKIILELENDNRTIKAKINQLITDTGASTTKFTNPQAAQITLAQLKTAIKNLLT